jgi:hypothetical protein
MCISKPRFFKSKRFFKKSHFFIFYFFKKMGECGCVEQFKTTYPTTRLEDIRFMHDGKQCIALREIPGYTEREFQAYYLFDGQWSAGAVATIPMCAPNHLLCCVVDDLMYDARVALFFEAKKRQLNHQ